MPVAAIGIDLGETLIHYGNAPLSWQSLYPAALRSVAAACGRHLSDEQIVRGASVLEHYDTRLRPRTEEVTAEEIFGRLLDAWRWPASVSLERVIGSFFDYFQNDVACYDDTVPVLAELRRRGLRIGVLTDVPYGMIRARVARDLEAADSLGRFVDVLLTSADVGHRKPAPMGYLRLAEALGVTLGEMWFVGNENKDVEGANAAGSFSVLIDRQETNTGASVAKARITGLRQLLPLIEGTHADVPRTG